jgi:hypothetical protein
VTAGQIPEPELTEEEKLIARLVLLNQRIPGGALIAMPIQLARSIANVTELFAEHDLPLREEVVAELTRWRDHAERGLTFLHRCDHLMQTVIRSVDV